MTNAALALVPLWRSSDRSGTPYPMEQPEFSSSWSLGEGAFQYIARHLEQRNARRILEFGSGVSSVRWLLRDKHAEVTAIEADEKYAVETVCLAKKHGVADRLSVLVKPLAWVSLNNAPYFTYGDVEEVGEGFDAVIIDGPPVQTRTGREACLYHAFPLLRTHGLVVLDDYSRVFERAAVEHWLRVYPLSLSLVETSNVGHGIAILEKRSTSKAVVDVPSLGASYLQAGRLALHSLRLRLRSRS